MKYYNKEKKRIRKELRNKYYERFPDERRRGRKREWSSNDVEASNILNEKEAIRILGVQQSVLQGKNKDERRVILKRAYRKKAMENHPDKGPPKEKKAREESVGSKAEERAKRMHERGGEASGRGARRGQREGKVEE